jgi:two-component sensor histidine kinase
MVNSIKYAFDEKGGEITIKLEKEDNNCLFTYRDNGKGVENILSNQGFGLNLIEMAVAQLDAHMKIINHHGLEYQIRFKGRKL